MAKLGEANIGGRMVPAWLLDLTAEELDGLKWYSKPNLLDNAYFVGGGSQQGGGQMPINQTGATSWTGSASYVALFDRWLGYYSGGGVTFSLTSAGVALPATSKYETILQRLLQPNSSMAGKTYTVSAIVGGELISATGEVTAVSSGDSTVFITSTESNGCIVRLRYSPTNGMFFEVYTPNGGVTVECCKLEEGSNQTLAYQDSTGAWHRLPQPEDGDYAGQLARCQRYLVVYDNSDATTSAMGLGAVVCTSNANRAYGVISLPCPMRITNPVVTVSGVSNIKAYSGGSVSSVVITSFNISRARGNLLKFSVDSDAGFTPGAAYYLETTGPVTISVSAQL